MHRSIEVRVTRGDPGPAELDAAGPRSPLQLKGADGGRWWIDRGDTPFGRGGHPFPRVAAAPAHRKGSYGPIRGLAGRACARPAGRSLLLAQAPADRRT